MSENGTAPEPAIAEPLLTPVEVGELLGVSPAWVREHAKRRRPRLPAVSLGKLLRFRRAEIERFLNDQEIS